MKSVRLLFLIFGLLSFVAASLASRKYGSKQLKLALDAAIVRVIQTGDYLSIEAQWNINTIASFSCTPEPDWYAFPTAEDADGALSGVLSSRKLRLATLGPFDWGADGDYTADPPVGFWPDYENAILSQLQLAYGADLQLERVFYGDSQSLLDALQAGEAHASGPYYVQGGAINGTYRQAVLRQTCSTLGYDSTLFTNSTSGVHTLQALQDSLRANPLQGMGALSEGDGHSVQPVIPDGVSFRYYEHEDDLVAAVRTGAVLAGVLSGSPSSEAGLSIFSSTLVSPRVMFLRGEEDECPAEEGSGVAAGALAAPVGGVLLAAAGLAAWVQ